MKEQSIILLVFCLISGSLSKPPPTFLEYKDSYGQYSFGYSAPGSARSEVRSLDGSTRGSYSYVDDAGVIQSTQYTADGENGFQVIATNLPRAPSPVVDTPEVAAARLEHLKALEDATKLANEDPQDHGQREAKIDEKNTDTVVIENTAKSVKNEIVNVAQAKNASEEKDAVIVNEVEKTAEGVAMQPIQSQSREAVKSDIPVVTTSFVIPGSVNLHSRIELVQNGAARLSSEPAAPQVSQPSQLQGSDFNPSTITPASTKLKEMSSSDREDMLLKIAPLPSAPMPSAPNYKPQSYSVSFVPGIVARSNIIALPYAVGSSPIYPQYNAYHQYFPFGVL